MFRWSVCEGGILQWILLCTLCSWRFVTFPKGSCHVIYMLRISLPVVPFLHVRCRHCSCSHIPDECVTSDLTYCCFLLFLLLCPSFFWPQCAKQHRLQMGIWVQNKKCALFSNVITLAVWINTAFNVLIKLFSDPSCSVDGGIIILEKTTPIRTEMFHQKSKW